MDLEGFIHHVIEHLRTVNLVDGTLRSVFFDPPCRLVSRLGRSHIDILQAFLDEARVAIDHALRDEGSDPHFTDLFLDESKIGNGMPELNPGFGVLYGIPQRQFGGPDTGASEFVPSDVEDIEGHHVPLSRLEEEILNGHLHVFQDEAPRGGAPDPHLVLFLSEGQPLGITVNDKTGKLLSVDLGVGDEDVRVGRVGNELLLTIQDIILPVFGKHGRGLGIQGVRPRFRLREGVGTNHLPIGKLREIAAFLIFVPEINDGKAPNPRVIHVRHGEGPSEGNLFRDNEGADLVQPHTAILLRDVAPHEPNVGRFLQEFYHEPFLFGLQVVDDRRHLSKEKLFRRFGDKFVLFCHILRGKDVLGIRRLNQKTATRILFHGHTLLRHFHSQKSPRHPSHRRYTWLPGPNAPFAFVFRATG